MILDDVEIKPMEIPKQTYLLIKCLGEEYAKDFIEKGAMRFAHPSEWCKPDKTSRYDSMEGVYASQIGCDSTWDATLKSLRKDVFTNKKKGFTFYKSNEVLSYRAYCLYGVNSNAMTTQVVRSQDHQYHQAGVVSKGYFNKLYPKVTKNNINTLASKDKPAVLFLRPDLFVAFVRTKLMEKGIKEEEIFISPVSYMDYFRKPCILGVAPKELFSKRTSYINQSEVRIVIDTRREEVSNLFDKNGVIKLGKVDESIATLQEFYFDDMSLEIRGKKLQYTLPEPKYYKNDEIGDGDFINVLKQSFADELPGAPMMSIDEIEKQISDILLILKSRDSMVKLDRSTNVLFYKGMVINIGAEGGCKILSHYNDYILSGDFVGAGKAVEKFKHFFPMFNMDNYFKAYYDWLEGGSNRGGEMTMTHDEQWLRFIESNKRNPSEHRIEEHLMLNFIKHNRKLLNAGKMIG